MVKEGTVVNGGRLGMMGKRVLSGLMAVVLLVIPALGAPFPDVDENAVYAEAVEYVSEAGIMEGKNGGNFDPEGTVTRAEMAAIICRMLGEDENLTAESDQFFDVSKTHWANKYVSKAAELGIVNGYGNGNFGPSDQVSYEQAVTMIIRASGLEDVAIAEGGYPDGYIETAYKYNFLDQISAEKGDLLARWQIVMILYNAMII